MALLTYDELQSIKPISVNNAGRFSQLIIETEIKDLKPLIGYEFYQDLVSNPDTVANGALLDGGTFTYNGVSYFYAGLKSVLAYFFYANYVMTSCHTDTFTGFVTKTNEDSQPASQGDKKNLRDLAIETALQYWEDCKKYIEANSADFPYYDCGKPRNNRLITI